MTQEVRQGTSLQAQAPVIAEGREPQAQAVGGRSKPRQDDAAIGDDRKGSETCPDACLGGSAAGAIW